HRITVSVAVTQLLENEMVPAEEIPALVNQLIAQEVEAEAEEPSIRLKTIRTGQEAVEFDILAYLAPGMALMFLMYTVSNGGRTLLAERNQGTLPRLLVAPVNTAQV